MLESISPVSIAVSGLKAQRIRMNVIANNIANAESTRTPGGGPFRRQLAIFRGEQLGTSLSPDKFGVWVTGIENDTSPFRTVYDPTHPDANADGIVAYPNINLSVEMINLISAQRGYEANIDVILSSRRMTQKALEIIQQ
ncbi:MAG: flagellar basal body rod protein FlgC [Candidatus Hydrogenedentes bacterium]|nr:flagellar basal body rod protein FlgC [Candidatus Hydrogenedentota bacterium]